MQGHETFLCASGETCIKIIEICDDVPHRPKFRHCHHPDLLRQSNHLHQCLHHLEKNVNKQHINKILKGLVSCLFEQKD